MRSMRMKNRVTLKDIAAIAGVSATTVSLALNRDDVLTEAMRRRIRKIAAETGYTPNAAARALRGVRTKSIGVVINYFDNASFKTVISGIEEVTNKAGVTFWVAQTHDQLGREEAQIRLLAEQGVDGIILMPCSDAYAHLEAAAAQFDIPIILIYHNFGNRFGAVQVDNLHGATEVTRHLLAALPDRPLVHLSGLQGKSAQRTRTEAFCAVMRELRPGVAPEEAVIPVQRLTLAEGYRAMGEALRRHSPPLSVFACTDNVALGVFKYCRDHGLRIPEDVALAGFAGIDTLEDLGIPLTTVRIPDHALGRAAAERLLECIDRPEKREDCAVITLPVSLIIRESTGGGAQPAAPA